MLGHKLWQRLSVRFDTWATSRLNYQTYSDFGIYRPERFIEGIDAYRFDSIVRAIHQVQPDVVINCIGVIKQRDEAKDPISCLTINALFPHHLSRLCEKDGIRLIHFSTDCVFSGRKGMYTEQDVSDAEDLYGRTKHLGEVSSSHSLTIRSSIIGRELNTAFGLVEWFLSNRGKQVQGYTQAIYSGFTTDAMAEIVAELVERRPALHGGFHISSYPITKFDLLSLIRDAYGLDIGIEPDDSAKIDRSLDCSLYRTATNFSPPTWETMISQMVSDHTPYDHWHQFPKGPGQNVD
jgi:dTDP-4-dehydrorhamnose reductase